MPCAAITAFIHPKSRPSLPQTVGRGLQCPGFVRIHDFVRIGTSFGLKKIHAPYSNILKPGNQK